MPYERKYDPDRTTKTVGWIPILDARAWTASIKRAMGALMGAAQCATNGDQ